MDPSYLSVGAPVVTARGVLKGSLAGSGVDSELALNRKAGAPGIIDGLIAEQSGELWTVRHSDGSRAAYHHDEIVIPRDARMPGGFR
jgi:hypothetical protein